MSAKKKQPKFQPTANPDMAAAMRGLRSSSAAQPHTPKPHKGTRAERQRDEITKQHDKS